MMSTLAQHRQDWEDLSALDPMWAILSHPGRENRRWTAEEFYATGVGRVEEVRKLFSSLGLPTSFDSVLDFGCGVGRLTYAWAAHARECVGVDISTRMIDGARAAGRGPHCQFVHNETPDLAQFPSDSFDLVFSDITLQHIPALEVIRSYLGEFVRVARPGGVIQFQLASRLPFTMRYKIRRPLYYMLTALGVSKEWLYGRFAINPMKMNALPVEDVVSVVERAGAVKLSAEYRDSIVTCYVFRKPSGP